jgi:two-component system, chemotaxis family, protein-glutamate methylesterase/glutaminase
MQNWPYRSARYRGFDVVAVGSSLGGPAALSLILASLPRDFPAAIVVAQHVSAVTGPSLVPQLHCRSSLPVSLAQNSQRLCPGHVYCAPFDHHLVIGPDRRIQLTRTRKVKFCRPAAEPLFASVAGTYRERALGLVLTGCNSDGSLGAQALKWMGGRVMVQDPKTARAPGMPQAAIATGAVDYVVPLDRIAAALIALVMVPGISDYLRVEPVAA